jgi:hypothetical protein
MHMHNSLHWCINKIQIVCVPLVCSEAAHLAAESCCRCLQTGPVHVCQYVPWRAFTGENKANIARHCLAS